MLLLNGLKRITPPAAPVITLEEARIQCRVDTWGSPPANPEDELLQGYIQSATDELDGIDGWLNRALLTQTWQLTLNFFPSRKIRVPLPPLKSVTSIEYDAPDGMEIELDPGQYRVITDTDPGMIEPVNSWPNTQDRLAAVRITYVAGYGDADAVPQIIKDYIKASVGQRYNFRELTVMRAGGGPIAVPYMRESLESIRMRGVRP